MKLRKRAERIKNTINISNRKTGKTNAREIPPKSPKNDDNYKHQDVQRRELEECKNLLHTSALPDVMLNREEDCNSIQKFIQNAIKPNSDTSSRVLYLSGVPGTGKTASVLKVIKDLKAKTKGPKFKFCNINGLELTDPKNIFVSVYRKVHEGETGARKKITAREAQQSLNDYFVNEENGRRNPIVILIDEVDMLYTKREEIVYTFFNWASQKQSRCSIIAISNTLDLAEREFSQRVVSRMGTNKLMFQPYTFEQIESILKHRIQCCKGINLKAIELASKKVASISGDLRKAFDLMRRAIDLAIEKYDADEEAQENNPGLTLLPEHILDAIKESTTSIRMDFIRALSKHEELLFRALVMDLHETGIESTDISRMLLRYKKMCSSENIDPLSLSSVFQLVEEMSYTHLVIVSSEEGMLHRSIKLGFPLAEAQFCVRQLDLSKNNLLALSPSVNPSSRSLSKSPHNSASNRSTTTRSNTQRACRNISFICS